MSMQKGRVQRPQVGMAPREVLPQGIDPMAVSADPQGYQQWQRGAQMQEQQRPGSTMLSGPRSVDPATEQLKQMTRGALGQQNRYQGRLFGGTRRM